MKVYNYQISEETRSLQRIDRTRRKPPLSVRVPRQVKESVVSLILDHDISIRQAALRNQIQEREALGVLIEHFCDREQRAVRAALITRGAAA